MHILTSEELNVDTKKRKTILELSIPASKKDLYEFLLRESFLLVYKLVVMGVIIVGYIRVGRTGVNAYLIRIKL